MRGTARLLLAALAALALVMAAPRAALADGAGTEEDPIRIEVGGDGVTVSLGDGEVAWFAFDVDREGDYAAWSEGDLFTECRLSSDCYDEAAWCEHGGDDYDNFRSVFHAAAGSSWRLGVWDTYGSGRQVTVGVAALDGASAGLTLGGVPEGEAVWLGEYEGVPVSWEQEGREDVPEGALGLRSRFALLDAPYHGDQWSCSGYADTDLYTKVLPQLREDTLSEPELAAAGSMGLPGEWWRTACRRNGAETYYWLRGEFWDRWGNWQAPYSDGATRSGGNLDMVYAVVPTLELDLSRVLLSSAAVGGKPAAGDGALEPIAPGSGGAKLTLLDDARAEFEASADDAEAAPGGPVPTVSGGTVSVEYSGAGTYTGHDVWTGANEHVSAVLCDAGGEPLCYGRHAVGGESGTADFALPAGLEPGEYTLRVFSEQCNGDYRTDYASAFSDIALAVTEPPAAQVLGHTLTLEGNIGVNTYLVPGEAMARDPEGYEVELWDGDRLASSARVSDVEPTTKTVDGQDYACYGFTVATAAKGMGTVFTMRVRGPEGYVAFADSDGSAVDAEAGLAYSVNDYLDDRIANGSEAMRPLARDMRAYGIYAAHYFAARGGSTDPLPAVEGFVALSQDDLPEADCYTSTYPSGIDHFEYRGTTLVLEDRTSFRLYFESDDPGALNVLYRVVDGSSYDPLEIRAGRGANSGLCYVEVPDIAAKRLDAMYSFRINNWNKSDPGDTVEIVYTHGPLGYVRWALGLEGRDDLRHLMSALYHYNQSAKAYFDSRQ